MNHLKRGTVLLCLGLGASVILNVVLLTLFVDRAQPASIVAQSAPSKASVSPSNHDSDIESDELPIVDFTLETAVLESKPFVQLIGGKSYRRSSPKNRFLMLQKLVKSQFEPFFLARSEAEREELIETLARSAEELWNEHEFVYPDSKATPVNYR